MDLFDTIALEIDRKVAQLTDTVSTGRPSSYEEYKSLCGEIKGLLYIKGYILDLKQHVENSDDE